MREALHVVREVARQFDDGGAEARFGPHPRRAESRVDELGEAVRWNLLKAHDGAGLVERAAPAEHPLHQRRFGSGEHVADLPLLLHGGAQRMLDLVHARALSVSAVERPDRLELVERDGQAAAAGFGDAARQREDLLGEPRDIAIGSRRGERQRQQAAAGRVALHANVRPGRTEHVAEPRPRPIEPRFDREQGAGVALEEGHVGAVAAHGDLDREGAAARGGPQRLPDERRLAVAPRRNEEDLLAGGEIAGEPVQLDLAIDERVGRDDLAVYEWIVHRHHRAVT